MGKVFGKYRVIKEALETDRKQSINFNKRKASGASLTRTGGITKCLCRYHGPKGLLGRGSDHEEAEAPQVDTALRCLHAGGAHLHHHRAHEEWISPRIPAGWVWLLSGVFWDLYMVKV